MSIAIVRNPQARKLVAYLMAVDKSGKPFEMHAGSEEAA
jgi:hypothetical protein